MGNITETPVWEEAVFQVETTTPLLGGAPEINSNGTATAGYLNIAQQQLANRTKYLKDTIENTDIDVGGLSGRVDTVETNLTAHIGSRGAAHTNATQTEAGFMSAVDKTKLNGIAEGAQVNTVTSVAGRTGVVVLAKADVGLSNVDNTADTAKPVSTAQQTALDLKANLASPTFTGTPTAPTATAGASTTQVANTAFVAAGLGLKANLSSPALTGTPTAPTATAGTNTTQIASTAFVAAAVTAGAGDATRVAKAGDTMTGQLIGTQTRMAGYIDKVFVNATTTGTQYLTCETYSVFNLTLTGATTLAISTMPTFTANTEALTIVVKIVQGASAQTLAWFSGVTWLTSGGTAPTTPSANKTVEYIFTNTDSTGVSWVGRVGASN